MPFCDREILLPSKFTCWESPGKYLSGPGLISMIFVFDGYPITLTVMSMSASIDPFCDFLFKNQCAHHWVAHKYCEPCHREFSTFLR